ncbi:MAG: hypothetical protein J0L70_23190 [Leptolyngbya sp. UWPOB_LEPTO1]|uniref:hypothetical protein n=1 Tax=Leptolyngbya sp. UWPOB_LEPTO1 TaxID=2815653 RepID=UPI001AC734D0|nr:hypothetical protein [Leptolyngbya sp. UWPOB_LEPTO1]MBN8563446.1 hypothetical protein [Leptolyngbya sp. UWPOB_LEPTO1]
MLDSAQIAERVKQHSCGTGTDDSVWFINPKTGEPFNGFVFPKRFLEIAIAAQSDPRFDVDHSVSPIGEWLTAIHLPELYGSVFVVLHFKPDSDTVTMSECASGEFESLDQVHSLLLALK